VFKPTIFSATNASGCLTLKFLNGSPSTYPGWAANIITYKPAGTPGSNITHTADKTSICPGGTVKLTATGSVVSSALNNDFNTTIGTGWVGSPAATITAAVCSAPSLDNSKYLWMQNFAAPRTLESVAMDVANGGTISFEYRQATYNSDASPCEAPDINSSGTTNEGIYVQYSTDNGTTWTTFKYIFSNSLYSNNASADPYNNGCGDYVTRWTKMTYPIPAAAKTAATKFRWIQPAVTSASTDNWGLDNVVVASPKTSTLTITDLTTNTVIATTTTGATNISVSPTTTTTYRATVTDGTTTATKDVVITVNSGTATVIGYPTNTSTLATSASPTSVTTISGSAPTAGSYTATPAGLTINATTGQITPSTSTPGTYTISATTTCGTTTATVTIAGATCACTDGAGSCGGAHFADATTAQADYNNTSSLAAAHNFSPVINSPNGTVKQFCWAYTTGAAETSVGFVNAVNSTHTLDGNGCTFTRTLQVAPVGGCGTPLTATGSTPFGSGSTYTVLPNTQYNFCATITVNDATCTSISDNFVWIYNNTVAGCTTCSNATCAASSITATTAALGQSGITTTLNSAGDQLGLNPLTAGQSATVCVPVTVPSGSTVLGFKNNLFTNAGCAVPSNLTITYQLKLASNCAGSAIAPNLTNASAVGSGFNPEWNNLAAGNYVLCYTIAVNAAMDPILCPDVDLRGLGYYNVVPTAVTCQPYVIQAYSDPDSITTTTQTTFTCSDPPVYLKTKQLLAHLILVFLLMHLK